MKRRDWLNSGLVIFALLIVAVLFAQSRLNCEIPGSSWVPCIWGEPLKRYQRALTDRHFPPPWTVAKLTGGLVVRDANGQSLAYVYYRENHSDTGMARVLTRMKRGGSPPTSPNYLGCLERRPNKKRAPTDKPTLFRGLRLSFRQRGSLT
jgi:hypothetical protein